MNKTKRSFKDIVFKCTYNDGGVGQNGIGFTKTYSDALIKQHIKDKKAWCSNDGCPCKNYIDGEISYGLYVVGVLEYLNAHYELTVISLTAPDAICIQRISERLGIKHEDADREFRVKEEIKNKLGNELLLQRADYSIDATYPIEEIVREVMRIIYDMP